MNTYIFETNTMSIQLTSQAIPRVGETVVVCNKRYIVKQVGHEVYCDVEGYKVDIFVYAWE